MSIETDSRLIEGRPTWEYWLLLLAGLLGVAAGIIVLAEPGISLATLAVVTGVFLLVSALFEIPAAIVGGMPHRGLLAVMGVLTAIAGVLLIRHPIAGVVAVALLLGLWLMTVGIVRLMASFDASENRGWQMVLALLEIAAGIVIVSSPGIGVATLALFIGIAFIARGIATCAVAWQLHDAAQHVAHSGPGAAAAT